jgi:hypothetical protein
MSIPALFYEASSIHEFSDNVKKCFREELKKHLERIGLSLSMVKGYEVIGKKLTIYLSNDQTLKIEDPFLCKLARLNTNIELLPQFVSREALEQRALAFADIYGEKLNPEEIKKYSPQQLLKMIREMEDKNRNVRDKSMRYVVERICFRVMKKSLFYPSDIEERLYSRSFQELCKIYHDLSTGRLSVEDLVILLYAESQSYTI